MPLRNVATNYTFEQQRQEINLLAADVDSLSTSIANQQGTETTDSPSFNSLYLGSTIYGPALFTIDPATHGDDTGTLVIKGNLQIDGTTTTVNSTTMTVNDLNITLADGASNAAAADGAGLTVDGAGATLLYNGTTDEWAFNKSLTSLSVNGSTVFSGQLNLGANMQFTAADPELEFNNGGPRFKVPAANTLSIHTGGGLGATTSERLRITSDGKLGINVTSPGCQTGGIHAVHDSTEGTPTFTGGEVAIFQRNFNNAQGCHIGIIGGSSGSSSINFGDKDDADVGIIQYAHSDNSMRFYVSAAEKLRILSTGGLKIGNRIIYGSLASDPTGINAGDEYFNTTNNVLKIYNGSNWVSVGTDGPAINTATNWWKNEGIAGTAGTWNWADSVGSQNMTYNLNGGGNSDITIATSSDLGNKNVFKKTSATYGHLLTNTTTGGTFHTNGNSWTAMLVYNKTAHNGFNSYGDAMFVHDRNGASPQDGAWSLDVAGDHTWGGTFNEVFGTNATGTTVPNKGIVMFRFNGGNGTIERYSNNAWSTLDTATSQPTNASYTSISLFSFHDASNTSHMYVGEIAEVVFWKGNSISDTERNAWSTYLSDKFNI